MIPRLADCSSGRTEMEFSEPGLAASGCALAAVENANIAAKGMHQLSRLARISFMTGSLKGIQTGFKAARIQILWFQMRMHSQWMGSEISVAIMDRPA